MDPLEVLKAVEGREFVRAPSTRWKVITVTEFRKVYQNSLGEKFWEREASRLVWKSPWVKTVEGTPPDTSWFVGGTLDVYQNVVEKHRDSWVWHKPAVV
ncbi:MAG: acetyl-coenzyme A synthetase N-terminal domain-containing protein, partial [Pyrobaculum sp.]